MTRFETEIARTDAARYQAQVAVNRLLDRGRDSTLVEMPNWRSIPPADVFDLAALRARAEDANPELLAKDASIEGAEKEASLAEKDWYPDVEGGCRSRNHGQPVHSKRRPAIACSFVRA